MQQINLKKIRKMFRCRKHLVFTWLTQKWSYHRNAMRCDAMRKGLNEARTRFILRIAKTNIFINAKLLYFAVSFIIIFWGKLTLTYNWFFLHPRKPRDQFKTSVRIHSIYSGLPEVYVPHRHPKY